MCRREGVNSLGGFFVPVARVRTCCYVVFGD
jgi:hypothetical protein